MKIRARVRNLLAAAAILITSSGAQAGTLPFTGTLSIDILGLPPLVLAGAGVAAANGSGGGSQINALALAGSTFATNGFVIPITDPAAFPSGGAQFTVHNDAGAFSAGSTLDGVMPLIGVLKACLFGPCASPITNVTVPLSAIGQGGAQAIGAVVNLTLIGAPWTTGTASVGTVTAMGAAHGPASATSSSFAPGGHLQLVTPIFVNGLVGGPLPSFATLTIDFVPEPTTLLLLGGGIAALGLAGRARR
jgi:hypothetical protein